MNDSVDSRNLAIQIIFLSQSTGGILGIVSVLSSYLICYYTECTSKLPDLTLTHLIMANSLTILSKRTLHTMALFKMKQFFNYLECKLILYVYILGRSISIATNLDQWKELHILVRWRNVHNLLGKDTRPGCSEWPWIQGRFCGKH